MEHLFYNFHDIQVENFKKITADIDLKSIPIVHIGRSLILVHHKKPDFVNGVRLGICMYGFSQSLPVPTGLRKIKRDLMLKNRKISLKQKKVRKWKIRI